VDYGENDHVYRDPEVAQSIAKSIANRLDDALESAEIEAMGGGYAFENGRTYTDEWTEAAAYKELRDKIAVISRSIRNDKW
jgi:hypothetical protein